MSSRDLTAREIIALAVLPFVILFLAIEFPGVVLPCVLATIAVVAIWMVVRSVSNLTGPRRGGPRHANQAAAGDIDVIELVMELEDEFRVAVPDEDYEKIKTVADALQYFERRKDPP
jgi:hypothetical protein